MLPRYNDRHRMRPPSFIARALARLSVAAWSPSRPSAVGGRLVEQQRFGTDTVGGARTGGRGRPARGARTGGAARTAGRGGPRLRSTALQFAASANRQAERRLFDQLLAAVESAGGRSSRRRSTARRPYRWPGAGRPSNSPTPSDRARRPRFSSPTPRGFGWCRSNRSPIPATAPARRARWCCRRRSLAPRPG